MGTHSLTTVVKHTYDRLQPSEHCLCEWDIILLFFLEVWVTFRDLHAHKIQNDPLGMSTGGVLLVTVESDTLSLPSPFL